MRYIPSLFLHIRSYLIYTISKDKEKNGESALAEIIEKILKESGIKGVAVNSRMITAFRKKIWLLEGKVNSARKKGGACVRRLLDMRKSSKYAFTVYITS